jgi:hypothetical protein
MIKAGTYMSIVGVLLMFVSLPLGIIILLVGLGIFVAGRLENEGGKE